MAVTVRLTEFEADAEVVFVVLQEFDAVYTPPLAAVRITEMSADSGPPATATARITLMDATAFVTQFQGGSMAKSNGSLQWVPYVIRIPDGTGDWQ